MNFVHYDLGNLRAGQTIEVQLDLAANVVLLDPTNFNLYRSGQPFSFFGGHVRQSPYRLGVPSDGHWHLAIDLGGRAGTIKTSVRVF
ncbi:MAG TPA: DUF1883 domain-containing protein [Solirubrobacteraceae bacterium]|jgi:hypothetical protein|nr:DUF1883 domain-containing protein [Solirubrobacteraceae bacterium]